MTRQDEYKKEQQEKWDRLRGAAQAVAAQLTGNWKVEQLPGHGWGVAIEYTGNGELFAKTEHEGARLFVKIDWGKRPARLVISGLFPAQYWPRERKTITVSLAKDTARICKDIERRLLPWYLPAYAEQMQIKAEREAYEAKKQYNAEALAAILGETVREDGAVRWSNRKMAGDYAYGDFEVYKDSVHLKLHGLPLNVAAKIAELIKAECN